jgi:ribosomal protein L11 methyltransferase
MTPPIRWLEIAVPAHAEAVEAVSEILSRVGYNGIAVEVPLERGRRAADHTVKAYVIDDADAFAKVSDVRDALGHLQAFGLGPIGELVARRVDDRDWLESWKADFVPIRIGAFLVRPTWSEAPAGDAIALVLDPGMAFGTGLHPTTQQCLEALSTLPLEGKSVLDVGTGSGILAIAAAKRGALPVVAVDTDALAVDAARENAVRNGVAIPVGEGSAADVPGRFDLVIANIVSPVLQRIAPHLAARLSGAGTLLVAGISAPAEAATRDALTSVGLGVLDRTMRDDWVALALCR